MTPVRVAVVVACFNDGATLGEALESLRRRGGARARRGQRRLHRPGDARRARRAPRGAACAVIDQENQGLPGGAHDRRRARRPRRYVYPLDADDRVMPGSARRARRRAGRRPGARRRVGRPAAVRRLRPRLAAGARARPVGDHARQRPAGVDARAPRPICSPPAAGRSAAATRTGTCGWRWPSAAGAGVHVGRPTHGYRIHGRRMLADTQRAPRQQFALLRERHPALFARRRSATGAARRRRGGSGCSSRSPSGCRRAERCAAGWCCSSRGRRMGSGWRRADATVSRAGPSASSAHMR